VSAKGELVGQGEVISDPDMFVNWADVPAVLRAPASDGVDGDDDGEMWIATWGRRRSGDAPGYFTLWTSSTDGEDWAPGRTLHQANEGPEFGFVSLAAMGSGRVASVWLDGRNLGDAHDHGPSANPGSMQLRGRVLPDGVEQVLDERVCDCCGTDTVWAGADQRLFTAYRDRSAEENRDVVLRDWSVASDRVVQVGDERPMGTAGWHIEGCPVNGPALALGSTWLAVASYSGTPSAHTQLTFVALDDAKKGRTVELDRAAPLGRVEVAVIDETHALVSWMAQGQALESGAGYSSSWRARVVGVKGESGPLVELVDLASSRASGFPQLVTIDAGVLLAWTEVRKSTEGESTRVRLALLPRSTLLGLL
jgi:hypothetical protein